MLNTTQKTSRQLFNLLLFGILPAIIAFKTFVWLKAYYLIAIA